MADALNLPTLYRDIVLDADELRAAKAAGDERIPMSLSSEYPVERGGFWDDPYMEVLSHDASAVDLSRAQGGLPLLLDHNSRDQIGIVEDVTIGADGKLRGFARFSRTARAQEIKQDVQDGIRTRTSIGYRVKELTQESKATKSAPAQYRATRWELYENSIVSIPADPTVGAGRNAENAGEAVFPVVVRSLESNTAPQGQEKPVSAETPAPPSGGAPPVTVDRGAEIVNLCQLAGMMDRAAELVNSEKPVAAVRAELAAAVRERAGAPAPIAPLPKPDVPDYGDGKRKFSIAKAILAVRSNNWKDAGYERDISNAVATRMGMNAGGNVVFVPTIVKRTEQEIEQRATQAAGVAATGGNTVFTEYGGFIEQLWARLVTGRLGVTMLPGLQGNVALPRETGGPSVSWMAEDPGADTASSNVTFDQVTLSPKTLIGMVKFSNQLLAQSVINVDAKIQDALTRRLARAIDAVALHGLGTGGQPRGIYNTTGVNVTAFGGSVTYAKLIDMITQIAAKDADYGDMGYAITPEAMSKAMQTSRFANTDTPLFVGTTAEGQVIGYRTVVSNQLAKTLGAGTNEHEIIAGVWNALYIGEWGGMSLTIDPFTLAGQDLVRIIPRMFVDVATEHPEAFTKGTGFIP